ncbi:MAG TPA: tRNA (adenosine(37)-N6)-threonylcarbamoyltransferase complex dimerization subunit type 1 TsaB [Candidatus Saccharimonadales bacterium]|nr:tRNA (adenosine(37)-N6)-threonylcarbamoyltransferase complex dimerization subunit type 1 TsaB [Candidatus Saccharimonadales bacterium]
MKLYIDTSEREKIIIGIDDEKFEKKVVERSSQLLLPFIDEILKKKKKNFKDIKEIEINTGPGSFTGLRIGVAIANTLGFVLNIPVNGKKVLTGPINITYK